MSMSALEEQLRESACYGDQDAMTSLLQAGVNVNSANLINGWTALHWACKVQRITILIYVNARTSKHTPQFIFPM